MFLGNFTNFCNLEKFCKNIFDNFLFKNNHNQFVFQDIFCPFFLLLNKVTPDKIAHFSFNF